jgi:hypothetical protein
MKTRAVLAGIVAVCLSAACDAETESPLVGVWRAAEVQVQDTVGAVFFEPPSLFIFTPTHYSMMRVVGLLPRPTTTGVDLTEPQKITAYDTFLANSGTYAVAGDTVTTQPIVSKHPNFMGGGGDRLQFRTAGDTLWLTSRSDGLRYFINGMQTRDTRLPVQTTTYKLVRVR